MVNSDSVIDYLVSLLSDSDSYVYTSGAIAEKFVLSMVSEMRDGSSLKDDEERFVEKMNSSSSDELWGSSSRLDYLKHSLPSDREAMMSLVMAYVKPILSLRNHLLKKPVFTVAVVGEPGSGKTTFVHKAFRTKKYQERTSEHQMHTRHIQSKEEDLVTLFNIFDFPGMNGNDAFAGADVSNLEAMIPALDCMLFFTKLNSRCFLAEELLKKVRGSCRIRLVFSHVDTCLQNKVNIALDDYIIEQDVDEEDVDKELLVHACVESLVADSKAFCDSHRVPSSDAVMWTPNRPLNDLPCLYKDALSPHLTSTKELSSWLDGLVG